MLRSHLVVLKFQPFGPSLLENAKRFLELLLLQGSRSHHPLPPVPLPDQVGCSTLAPNGARTPSPPGKSFLPYLRLRLPRPIHRLPRPADVTPADLHPHPFKRPVVEGPGRDRIPFATFATFVPVLQTGLQRWLQTLSALELNATLSFLLLIHK